MKRKSIKLLSSICLAFLLMLAFNGCKKNDLFKETFSKTNEIEAAKSWYYKNQIGFSNSIRSSKGLAVVLTFYPQWEKADVLNIDGTSVMVMPVKTNLNKLDDEIAYNLIISKRDEKYIYKTVAIKNLEENNQKKLSSNDLYLASFTDKKPIEENALGKEVKIYNNHFEIEKIALYDDKGIHLTSFNELSKLNNAKREVPKLNDTKTDVTIEVTICIDYYLVTQYYDANNNFLYETSRYLRRDCETRQIDWIDNDPNGTGSGGTSSHTDTASVMLNFATPVSIDNGSTLIFANDTARSKKLYWTFANDPDGGYKFKSREIGTQVKFATGGGWQWATLSHDMHWVEGGAKLGEVRIGNFNWSQVNNVSSVTAYVEWQTILDLSVNGTGGIHNGVLDETFHKWSSWGSEF